jgi:hypothetical protein
VGGVKTTTNIATNPCSNQNHNCAFPVFFSCQLVVLVGLEPKVLQEKLAGLIFIVKQHTTPK